MLQQHYDEFYEEVFFEIEDKYGEIEEMNVCENLGDHLVGNVYIKFYRRVSEATRQPVYKKTGLRTGFLFLSSKSRQAFFRVKFELGIQNRVKRQKTESRTGF